MTGGLRNSAGARARGRARLVATSVLALAVLLLGRGAAWAEPVPTTLLADAGPGRQRQLRGFDDLTYAWTQNGATTAPFLFLRAAARANRAPVFAEGTSTTRTLNENSPGGTPVGKAIVATDPDFRDTLTYRLSGPARASFAVDPNSGQLTVASGAAIDYESGPSLTVTVTVADRFGATASIEVVVNIVDVDEPPSAPTNLSSTARTSTSVSMRWTAPDDPDRPGAEHYLVQYRPSNSQDWKDTVAAGVSTTLNGLASFTAYDVRVQAISAEGASAWSTMVRISTEPAETPCTHPASSASTEVTPVVTSTSSSISITFTGSGQASFYLCAPSGSGYGLRDQHDRSQVPADSVLKHTFTNNIKPGTLYWVGAKTSTPDDMEIRIPWTKVRVPYNQPPTFDDPADTIRTVIENSVAGVPLGNGFSATDPEGDTLDWSLSGPDADLFEVVGAGDSAQIRFVSGTMLDYETRIHYQITLAVHDNLDQVGNADSTADASLTITVSVVDVSEVPDAPEILRTAGQKNGGLQVRWSPPAANGRPPVTDYDLRHRRADSTDTFTDAGYDGTATVTTISGLGDRNSYEVQVRARNRDGPGEWSTAVRGTSGTPPNTPPAFAADSTVRMVEDYGIAGTAVGAAVTAQQRAGETDPLVYQLSGADASYFSIDSTGQIRVAKERLPGRIAKPSYELMVEVGDNLDEEGVADTAVDDEITVTVAVTDLHADPGICARSAAVQAAILAQLAGIDDCAEVGASDLARVVTLDITGAGVTALARGDFRGLSPFRVLIKQTSLTALPAGLFDGLVYVHNIEIVNNALLTGMAADTFEGLTRVGTVNFLTLINNALTTLPAEVFRGVSAHTIALSGNSDLTLEAGTLTGLSVGDRLLLANMGLTALPAGLFRGAALISRVANTELNLTGNPGADFDLHLRLEEAGELLAQVRLVEGSLYDLTVPLVAEHAELFPRQAVISAGGEVSGPIVVQPSGTGPVRVRLGTPTPALPEGWGGVGGFAFGPALVFAQPPPAPQVAAEPQKGSVRLSWEVAHDGGAELSAWQYRVSTDGGVTWGPDWTDADAGAAAAGQTVTRLLDGVSYTFEVRAVNAEGASPAARVQATPVELQPLPDLPNLKYAVGRTIEDVILPAAVGGRPPYIYTLGGSVSGRLPSGLQFDATKRRLHGTPSGAYVGVLRYQVVDADGTSVHTDFWLQVVTGGNRAPRTFDVNGVRVASGTSLGRWNMGTNPTDDFLYTDQPVTGAGCALLKRCSMFSDPDSDELQILVSFEDLPDTMRPRGTGADLVVPPAPNPHGQTLMRFDIAIADRPSEGVVTITADDGHGGQVSRTLTLYGKPPPDTGAPTFGGAAVAELRLEEEVAMAPVTLPAPSGGDVPAGGQFTYHHRISGLPPGVSFDPVEWRLSGAPASGAAGLYQAVLRIHDRDGVDTFFDAAELGFTIRVIRGVCGRPAALRDALTSAAGVAHCGAVTGEHLAQIESLDVADSGLSALRASDLSGLAALQRLDLSGNRGLELDDDVFRFTPKLQALQLDGLLWTALPAGLASWPATLQELSLNGNRLRPAADMFAELRSLRRLSLRGNRLAVLPADTFKGLPGLQHLDLAENSLAQFSAKALGATLEGFLSQLQTLSLRDNRIAALQTGIWERIPVLRELDLSGNRLSTLESGGFEDLTKLQTLDLSDNPGAPFSARLSLEHNENGTAVRVKLSDGVPFVTTVSLSILKASPSDRLHNDCTRRKNQRVAVAGARRQRRRNRASGRRPADTRDDSRLRSDDCRSIDVHCRAQCAGGDRGRG